VASSAGGDGRREKGEEDELGRWRRIGEGGSVPAPPLSLRSDASPEMAVTTQVHIKVRIVLPHHRLELIEEEEKSKGGEQGEKKEVLDRREGKEKL